MNPAAASASPITLSPLPYAFGEPPITAVLRQSPADFCVEEILGFEPAGEGEHVFLWIEKIGLNTQQVADQLARLAKIPARLVSYSGMKDRHAVTRQWFSVHMPGNSSVDWELLNTHQLKVLRVSRHLRKLRRGVHKGNHFVITLTELQADISVSPLAVIEHRAALLASQGVPNYFGEQRFGFDGSNLLRAQQLFAGAFKPKRHQRGIYISAARSYIFNQVLAERVANNSWNHLLGGELLMLDGSHSVFAQDVEQEHPEPELVQRLLEGDIHLTGPLYGKPASLNCSGMVAALELAVVSSLTEFRQGLDAEGLKAERRALRVIPQDIHWQLQEHKLLVSFSLPSGSFATAVLRELVNYRVNHSVNKP